LQIDAQGERSTQVAAGAQAWLRAEGSVRCTFESLFAVQLSDAIRAFRDRQHPLVDARSTVPALQLVETCYRRRALLPMPWLSAAERACARKLGVQQS
jgi:hypothetical protein